MTHPARIARVLAVLAQLDGIDVVSLDVFDTLLVRLTTPRRTLAAVTHTTAQRLREALPAAPDAAALSAHRDAFARDAAARPGRGGDHTVRAWLAALARDFALDPTITTSVGLAAELDVERRLTRADPDAIALLDALRDRGLRVIAASDTWLDTDVLAALLAHHGLAPDHVFSSGAVGLSKRRGALFAHIAHKLGVAPHAMLHVGDAWKADVARPLQSGCWIAPWARRDQAAPARVRALAPELALLCALPGATASATAPSGPLAEAGRLLLAPLLTAITVANHAALSAARPDHIFYLARDAWPLYQAAERLAPQLPPPASASYLRLSRRAVSLAHPGDLLQRGTGVAGKYGKSRIGDLLSAFDLSDALRHDLLDAAGLIDASSASPSSRLALVQACSRLAPRIAAEQRVQRELLRDYLMQHAGGNLGRVALIDTGWAGTTQDAVAAALPDASLVLGLYLGVSGAAQAGTSRVPKLGLLWDDLRGLDPLSPLERTAGVIRVWELLLREPAPTVRRLVREADGRVAPELREVSSPADGIAAAEVARGVQEGLDALEPVLRDVLRAVPPHDPAWSAAARALAWHLTVSPPRELVGSLLALEFDEGAVQGRRSQLGTSGLRAGLAWLPGLATQAGGAPAVWGLDAGVRLYAVLNRAIRSR